MAGERTIDTVAQFEGWLAANRDEHDLQPAAAAGTLEELFRRAERGGADLHDPTAELLLWISRDLVRDRTAAPQAYPDALAVLSHYLLYLRAQGLWRRSERALLKCGEALDHAAQPPLGLTTLGADLDAIIAAGRLRRPTSDELLAIGIERGYVGPLQATLGALAVQGSLEHDDVAALAGVSVGSVDHEVWIAALQYAHLVRADEHGRIEPLREVREAGGCPPPSADLIARVVRALVRAAVRLLLILDGGARQHDLPRTRAGLVALVRAIDPAAQAEPAESAAPGSAQADGPDAEAGKAIQVLVRFGVLTRGPHDLTVPAPFHHAVLRAISDVTGLTGTTEETAPWEPIEPPFSMAPDVGVDLLVCLEHDPQVWRRFRVLGSATLDYLHRCLQTAFGWRDVRDSAFCTSAGTFRFAPPRLLGRLHDERYAAVVDSDAVRIGSVLKARGDELVYLYGSFSNPWRVRLTVERVMSGMKEQISWLDRVGDVPPEPSAIGEQIRARLPEGMTVPEVIEQAWTFMESKQWVIITDEGVSLVAPGPPAARPAMVFSSALTLADKLGLDSPVLQRTFPIAVTPGDTSLALWLDDEGATWVVAFGPEGEASIVGSPTDLLRLAAVGYADIGPETLGQPPQDPEAVAGLQEFRDWVHGVLGADVPPLWGAFGEDHFTQWVAAQSDSVD